jgi:hypothetical protein
MAEVDAFRKKKRKKGPCVNGEEKRKSQRRERGSDAQVEAEFAK